MPIRRATAGALNVQSLDMSTPILRLRTSPAFAIVMFIATAAFNANAQTSREYRLEPGAGGLELTMRDVAQPQPGDGEVLVRVRAVSLNHRDLSVAGRSSSSVRLNDGRFSAMIWP